MSKCRQQKMYGHGCNFYLSAYYKYLMNSFYSACETSGIKQQQQDYFVRFICRGYTCLQAQHFKGSFYKGRVSNSTQLNRTDYRKFYPCLLILLRTARIQTLISSEWWRQLPSYVYTFCVRHLTPRKFFYLSGNSRIQTSDTYIILLLPNEKHYFEFLSQPQNFMLSSLDK